MQTSPASADGRAQVLLRQGDGRRLPARLKIRFQPACRGPFRSAMLLQRDWRWRLTALDSGRRASAQIRQAPSWLTHFEAIGGHGAQCGIA